MFETPSTGEGIPWADLMSSLLVIEVLGQEHGVTTVHGTADPVRANVYVVDGPLAGTVYDDAFIFPRALISQTRRKVGSKVLGRLGQGPKEPGKNPPWRLEAATSPEVKLAEEAMRRMTAPAFAPPGGDEPPF